MLLAEAACYTIPPLMPKITVDGKTIDAKDRQMILQACNDAGIAIPQYCYHPGLSIPASCRICLVEVEGLPKLVPSCQTPVRDGMVVYSKVLQGHRQSEAGDGIPADQSPAGLPGVRSGGRVLAAGLFLPVWPEPVAV